PWYPGTAVTACVGGRFGRSLFGGVGNDYARYDSKSTGISVDYGSDRWSGIRVNGHDGLIPSSFWCWRDGEFIHRCWVSGDGHFYDQFLVRRGDVPREISLGWGGYRDDVAGDYNDFGPPFSIGKSNGFLVGRWTRSNYLAIGESIKRVNSSRKFACLQYFQVDDCSQSRRRYFGWARTK